MAAIHRLLCTHCTFGSSELELSTAENAAKVLGYSVRRSSLPEPDRGPLQTTFHAVERLLSYNLPKDTPPARKESLSAETAPRRLIFMPNLAGWQAAAHVSYRTRDTHGRVGSYFADVIAARLDRDTRPWCQLEILKLWSASNNSSLQSDWWCDSEESLAQRDGDGRWKPSDVTAVAELRGDAGPFIDDRLLYQFLTLEPGNAAHDPGQIVPARWWSMPALQRRDLLAALLNATIQSRRNGGRENAVIAAEPAVAAVLFYGVFRLLPPRLREGIGFSTYEAFPERPLTPLVATTFLDGEASPFDLPPELVGRGFACNTFRDVAKFGRTQPIAVDGFVRRVIDLALTSNCWERLDGFLTSIDALPRPDFRNLDELARNDAFLTKYLTSSLQSDDATPEPPASPGSDGENYRRIRFCTIIGEVTENHAAKLPHNIVRKAIEWLGEDFPKQWDNDGKVASALRARMPETDNELAAVFKSMKAARTVAPAFVGEAVVRVALASRPQALPSSYVKFVSHDGSNSGARGGAVAGSVALVQPVLERLAAERRQDLIEVADAAFVEPFLESVATWEKKQPGRWKELQLPLLPLVEHELRARRTTTKERAEFLVRHDALAKVLDQCAVPPALSEVMDGFFSHILRLNQTKPKSLQPGELLSNDGQSRAEILERWLVLAEPDNKRRYQERLAAWKSIHEIILVLRLPAEKAGRFSKCTEDVSRFAEAYEVLLRDNPVPGKELVQQLSIFLAKSMDGLKVASEPARKTIRAGWLRHFLATVTAQIRWIVAPSENGGATRSGRGQSQHTSTWIYVGIGTSVLLIGGLLAGRLHHDPQSEGTPTTSKKTREQSEAKQTTRKKAAATQPQNSRVGTETAKALVARPPDPPPAPERPVTPEAFNVHASLESGAIKVSWDRTAVNGAGLELRVTIPDRISPRHEKTVIANSDVDQGATTWKPPQKNFFGNFVIQLIVLRQGLPAVESAKVVVAIPKPPVPQIKNAQLFVAKDGKPTLSLQITAPSESDLAKYGTCKAVLSTPDGSEKREVPFSESLSLPLPDRNLTPTRLLDGKSPLKLHLETDLGASSSCDVPAATPVDFKREICRALSGKKVEGVTHACPIPEKCEPPTTTDLLDLPWWFVDVVLPTFDLQLLPSGRASTDGDLDPSAISLMPSDSSGESLKRWECRTAETTIGFFEIYSAQSTRWLATLRFVATAPVRDDTKNIYAKAYEQLRTYRLCFLQDKKPFCTAQLLRPLFMGPLVFRLPRNDQQDALPLMTAKVGLPAEWVKLSLHEVLAGSKSPEQPPEKLYVTFDEPNVGSAFVAKVVVKHGERGENQITADVNLIKPAAERDARLQINRWKWAKAPHDKTKKKQDAPAATNEAVSPKRLAVVGERLKRWRELDAKVLEREQSALEELDEPKKKERQRELNAAKDEQAKLVRERQENNDDTFVPCVELLDAIVEHDVKIDSWRLQWDVQSKSCGGLEVPASIPGGVTVVGAVGGDGGHEEVKFEAEKKK